MNKLEKARLILDFWFSPWSELKPTIWASLSKGKPYTELHAQHIIATILAGVEDVNWDALDHTGR